MGVVSVYFSTWVRDQVGALRADYVYGVITAISMGLIFIASPILGAMTDRARRRMPFEFERRPARYVRFTQQGTEETYYWSVAEMRIVGE